MAVKIRRGITAVIFRKKYERKEPEFLILHRIKRWKGWEMLKGGKRGKEKPIATLKREIIEETGAKKFNVIAKLPFVLRFKIPKQHVREMRFTDVSFPAYLVEYFGPISLINNKSIEHSKYKWVKYKDALKLLTFDTSKKELKAAHSFMKSRGLI